ncbi:MAG: Flp pilus assembly protein CpaB [Candidatus Binataceae bacterium]|nr:Flp pilus assembly protein CpaB [Candidatus Binataceae bacterium]
MRRPMVYVVLAGVSALVAALVVYSALKKREAEVQQAMVKSVEVVVAARDLPLGSRIDARSVKLARWARDSTPPGAITDPQSVMNAFVKDAFVTNEPIVSDKLFTGAKTAGVMPLLIPAGMRAMSVPVDEVSDIAGFVLPHTRVDVLVAVPGNGPEGKPFSKIVLQNVEVLAVAQEIEHTHDQPQVVKVVTLIVTPQEAERLALASREGSLHLAMRSYDDHKIVMTTGVSIPEMLHSYSDAPAPMVVSIQHGHVVRQPAARVRPIQIQIMRDGKSAESVSFVRQPSPERASAGYWITHSSSGERRNHAGNGAPATLPDPVEAKAPAFVGNVVPASPPAALKHTRSDADSGIASDSLGDSGLSAPTPKTIDVP